MIKLETRFTKGMVSDDSIKRKYQSRLKKIIRHLQDRSALGSEMSGWISYVHNYDYGELERMEKISNKWKKQGIKKVVVIGIGGSYLGIKAGIDMLSSEFLQRKFQVYFAHNFNQNYLSSLLASMGDDPFGIIVISKSGNTLEPAVALELFRKKLEKNIGPKKANEFIVAVTDKEKGTLRDLVKKYKWESFVIPNNIGGRYSALTPCGMFLFVLLGFDYKAIILGAMDATMTLTNPDLDKNSAFKYACYRHFFSRSRGKEVENFIVYDPGLNMMCEVWKQLFGESEGKDHKALYPTTSLFTTDLHSMGQYLQEGRRNFFETTLFVKEPIADIKLDIKSNEANLKYINGKTVSELNRVAMVSTVKAHYLEGKVDNLIIYVDKQDAYHFGYLYMWLCFAAMCSAYLLKLNPFNQPGVEIYKKRIAKILKRK